MLLSILIVHKKYPKNPSGVGITHQASIFWLDELSQISPIFSHISPKFHKPNICDLPPMVLMKIVLNQLFLYKRDKFVSFQRLSNHVYKSRENNGCTPMYAIQNLIKKIEKHDYKKY